MGTGRKPIGGVEAPNPGIAPEIEGAPATMPGGNDGKDKTTMTGTPATVAVAPPPISADMQGGPNYVAVDPSRERPQTTTADVEADGPTATTDMELEPTAETPSLSPEEQAKADAVMGYDQQIETLRRAAEQYAPETEEQRKKRERREKSKKIIAAVSDGISALSNLYFTSQYAPNMYSHEKGSMMNTVNDRIERLKAEREKNADKHLHFALKLGDLQNDRAKTLRELEAQQERQKLAREAAQRDAEKHGWLALLQPDKQREQKGKADRAEQEAVTAQAEAQNAPAMQAAKLDTEKARAGAQRASAAASKASAANSYASAAEHNAKAQNERYGKPWAYDKYHRRHTFNDWETAEKFARMHGTWVEYDDEEVTETEKTNGNGRKGSSSYTSKVKTKGYPRSPEKKKASPTAGGGGGNGKKSPTA